MRIALDVTGALAGSSGVRVYVERLLSALAAVDREDEFLVYGAFWTSPKRLAELALPEAPNFSTAVLRLPQRLLLPAEELGLPVQRLWLRRRGVRVFHGLSHLAPALDGIASVVTLHHVGRVPNPTPWHRFYFEWLARRSARRADAVISVSEFSRREAMSQWGLADERVVTIPEGGPDPAFRQAPPGAPSPRPYPYVLHVGAFVERKNLDTLARAFQLWARSEPARTERLVLAGRPDRDFGRIRALIHELGLDARVELLTNAGQEEIVALHQHAAAAVVPSLLEGFGFPVLEAMACGAPAIVSRAASLPEVAGDAALLFDPLDAEALAAALGRVLSDAALAAELRRKGLRRVRDFSWEEAARRTVMVYRKLAGTA